MLSGLAALAAAPLAAQMAAQCSASEVTLKGPWGQARFQIELADDPTERALGLMHRARMPLSHGMLFIYPEPTHAMFWMKDTLIPLDMLFLDATGTVTRIHENARPLDTTPIDGGSGVVAVLEINGGLARAMGITEGTVLRNPAIGPAAAWPCDTP